MRQRVALLAALRSEANKCAVTYKEKQALVENQIM